MLSNHNAISDLDHVNRWNGPPIVVQFIDLRVVEARRMDFVGLPLSVHDRGSLCSILDSLEIPTLVCRVPVRCLQDTRYG
jgi:hypothetical protein